MPPDYIAHVTTDTIVALVDHSTSRFLDGVAGLSDAQAREPSLLPGWTRAHVLSHVARNADGLVNLLTWAQTGERVPMYASRDVRDADIATGAERSADELRADVEASSARLLEYAEQLDASAWEHTVEWGAKTRSGPASFVLVLRAAELELHLTDLGLDHPPTEWPADLVTRYLPYAADDLAERAGESLTLQATDTWAALVCGAEPSRTVEGPHSSLTAWVTGRSDGSDLVVVPEGDLPQIGDWR